MKDKGMWLGLDPFSQDWNIKLENRDEIKFTKFVGRLRKKFSDLFHDLLKTQLILG